MYATFLFVHKEKYFTLKMETCHLNLFRRPGDGETLVYCFTVNFACFTYFTKLEFELLLLYFSPVSGSFTDCLGLTARVPFLTGAGFCIFSTPLQTLTQRVPALFFAGKARTR
jgi:hypothetical protein